MRHVNAVGGFLGEFLLLTSLLCIAWAAAWIASGIHIELEVTLTLSAFTSLLFCAVRSTVIRRKPKTSRALIRFSLISAVSVFVGVWCLHSFKDPPMRFAFLGSHPFTLSMEPGIYGLVEVAYSFRGNPEKTISDAAKELGSLGFKVDRKKDSLFATLERSHHVPFDGVSVQVSSGRVVGKHFVVDGDIVDIEKRDDWVTVDVTQPDTRPTWVRVLAP